MEDAPLTLGHALPQTLRTPLPEGASYAPNLPLRAHQLAALEKQKLRPPGYDDVFSFFDEMGTGKSATLLADWGAQSDELSDLLIVAPAGSYRNWWSPGGELDKHLSPALRFRTAVNAWISGPRKQHRDQLARFLSLRDRPRVLCVNVEALGVVEEAQNLVTEFLAAGRAMWAIDESTRIRTPDAKRTDWIVRAGEKARARRILSGLPTPRSPLDLFSQFEFLDWRILGHRDHFTFRLRYAITSKRRTGRLVKRKRKGQLVWEQETALVDLRPEDMDDQQRELYDRRQVELRLRIAPWHSRALKRDCLDLPEKIYERHEVELTDEQRRVYNQLKSQATSELDDGGYVSAERRVTQILRLHQVVVGHVTDESGAVRALKSHRAKQLMEVLEEGGEKAVIWFDHRPPLAAVAATLRKEFGENSVAEFHGGNRDTRHEDEAKWRGDKNCRFLLATVGAGGVGNNWTETDLAIYFSNSYDLEHRQQSEDRHHRIGQTRRVTYVDLVAPGTVDERILDVLREKRDMASALMGDEQYREWLR
jgi:SNF2 family DNA or RNA helicase